MDEVFTLHLEKLDLYDATMHENRIEGKFKKRNPAKYARDKLSIEMRPSKDKHMDALEVREYDSKENKTIDTGPSLIYN